MTAVLLVAACGGGTDEPAAAPADQTVAADSGDTASVDTISADPGVPAEESEPAPSDSVPVPEPSDAEPADAEPATPDPTDAEPDEPAPAEPTGPEPTAAPPAEPAATPVGGRELGESLAPESSFSGNPLPDLVVDDVGHDAKVNIANILPSDRPVLVWAWAPH